jgi:transcriptional regulator with XRE-family HTH domain
LTVNQSYVGQITNPIVEARIEKAMSANALAKRLGLSRQYLNNAEQGIYSSLNPSLVRWISNAMGWTENSTTKRYMTFQNAKRRNAISRIEPRPIKRHANLQAGYQVFEEWRNDYWPSPRAFAVDFCIHPDLIQKYEEGIQKSMPKLLKQLLNENELLDPNWYDDLLGEAAHGPLSA